MQSNWRESGQYSIIFSGGKYRQVLLINLLTNQTSVCLGDVTHTFFQLDLLFLFYRFYHQFSLNFFQRSFQEIIRHNFQALSHTRYCVQTHFCKQCGRKTYICIYSYKVFLSKQRLAFNAHLFNQVVDCIWFDQ